jgi:myo-inositol-1(or 4)-monophosphatase
VSTRAASAGGSPTPGSPFARELDVAISAALQAGAIQRRLFERLERVTPKGRRDVVTEADYESEAAILGAIRSSFPGDATVSEEAGAQGVEMDRAMDGPLGPAGAARTWFIDPLDGTVNFANGIPVFCAVVGFALEGRPTVAAVYDPARDELLFAARGAGAFLGRGDGSERRVFHVRPKPGLEESVVGMTHSRGFLRTVARIRPLVRAVRDLGSASLSIAYVGGSRLDAYVQPGGLSGWDVCAPGLIAEEGGTHVTSLDGGPWFRYPPATRAPRRRPHTLGILCAAPSIHTELLRLVKG